MKLAFFFAAVFAFVTLFSARTKASQDLQELLNALLQNAGSNFQDLTVPVPYSLCDDKEAAFTVKKPYPLVEPWPIVPGEDVEITLSGVLSKVITEGAKALIKVSYHGITVFSQTRDYCGIPDANCPIETGTYTQTVAFPVPEVAITGTYDLHIETLFADESRIFCYNFKIPVN